MTTKQLTLSTGKTVQVTRHNRTETPRLYPEKIVRLRNGTVGLVNPHSAYFVPTAENQKKLEKITKQSTHWFYIDYLSRTR